MRFLPSKRLCWRLAFLLAILYAGWLLLPLAVPLPRALLVPAVPSPQFVASGDEPLRQLLAADGQRVGDPVSFGQIPESLVHATLAAEDKRFFAHSGIDWLATGRAAWSNLTAGRIVSGASTITQQLVKISADEKRRRTLMTKCIEALQARRLEQRWTKEEILAAYLNRVSFGNLLTGCASAASGYFNKPLGDLTPAEAAFLAGLPQSPGRLNPFRDPKPALKRQQLVLDLMREAGWLTPEEWEVARQQEIKLDRFTGGFAAPHAVGMLKDAPASASGTVRTTIDASLQRQIETIITQRLAGLESRHVTQAAAVVIENRTGHVLALAGSRDFFASDGGQINGAWSPHSPGSAVKPFTYLLAFEKGRTPATLVADLPVEYMTTTGTYRPENYDRRLYGPMTCRMALGNSLNISAVKMLQDIGGPAVLLDKLRELGLTTLDESAEHYGLGLTIGNAPVRLVELANAYATLARLGISKPWTLLPTGQAAERRLFAAAECWLIADILSDNQARSLTFGLNSPLRLPFRVAAKTGTSSTYRDNWTLGFVPEFTVGVWAGNFDNTPMQGVSGVTGAAPIFNDIFTELDSRFTLTWYERPSLIVSARIDPRNGKRLTPQSPPARMSRDEFFVQGTEPAAATPGDYDEKTGRALLPPEYARWVQSSDNWLGDLVTSGDNDSAPRPLRIIHPLPGTVIRLDPDLPNNGSHLLLQAEPADGVSWSSPTLTMQNDGSHRIAILKPGRHQITAAFQGQSADTFVIVEQE